MQVRGSERQRAAVAALSTPFAPGGQLLSAALSWLPALNFGTVVAAIWTRSPVRGFTPCRAALAAAENLPKPVKLIESPLFRVSVTASMKASTALPASRAERPLFA